MHYQLLQLEWNDPTTVYTSQLCGDILSPCQLHLHQLTQRKIWREHIFQNVHSCFIKLKLIIWPTSFICKINSSLNFLINKYLNRYLDSDSKRIRQKFYQFFINEKFKKIFYLFICMLPNYMVHDIIKFFWKKRCFENMPAGFPLMCQNPLR